LRSRFVSCALVALLVLNLFMVLVKIQPVLAASTITILPDGSIQPPTASIQRSGSSYTLTENITFNNPGFESAIRIECSNITFDGNGFALNNANSKCIYVIYATNVTIKNTTIKNAGSIGIYFYQCYNCTVAQNFLTNCSLNGYAGAIQFSDSKYFNVTQNTITELRGRYYGSVAIASGGEYHNISNNQIYNVYHGISISSHDSIVQGNIIKNASNDAIMVLAAQDTLFLDNNVSDSGVGLDLGFESQSNTISGNIVNNSRYYGIKLSGGCQYTTIIENNVTNTWETVQGFGFGIYVQAPSYYVTVSKNYVMNNAAYGVMISGESGQSVTENYIANNGVAGLRFEGGNEPGTNGLISRNFVTNNSLGGIQVGSSNYTTIWGNTVVNNKATYRGGIELSNVYHSRIYDNKILNNTRGFYLDNFGYSSIYHNHITDNSLQVYIPPYPGVLANTWDDGYPSGGNYWSNYTGADLYKGPN